MQLTLSPEGSATRAGRIWRLLSQPHYGILFLAVVATGLLAVDRVTELRRLYQAEERRAAMMVGNFALGLARDIELRLAAIDEALATLSEDLRSHPGFTTPGDASIEMRLKRRLAGLPPDVRGFYVLDENGRFIHNTESRALLGADRSNRDYFTGARNTDGLFIGAPIRSRTDEEVVLSLTRRIDDAAERFAEAG